MLLLKLTLMPTLILAATAAGRRWGPAIGGWLAGLPITSGPLLAFLAYEQGPGFAAEAATAGAWGIVGFAVACWSYAAVAARRPWWLALAAMWGAFAALGPVLIWAARHLPLWLGVLAVVATVAVVWWRFPRPAPGSETGGGLWRDLTLRVAGALAMVLLVTGIAALIGPATSGLLMAFPTAASVLGAATQVDAGPGRAALVLRGMVLGITTVSVFLASAAWLLPVMGPLPAIALALVAALIAQAASWPLARRPAQTACAEAPARRSA
jgi:hypothetical protein